MRLRAFTIHISTSGLMVINAFKIQEFLYKQSKTCLCSLSLLYFCLLANVK